MSDTYALKMSTNKGATFTQYGTGMSRDDVAASVLQAIDVGNATVQRRDDGCGYEAWETGAGIVWQWIKENSNA